MNTPLNHRSSHGLALIVTLGAIALLTVAIVAFFSIIVIDRQISYSGMNQMKAEQMAQTATDLIIGVMREEIQAGSVAVKDASGRFSPAYLPDTNLPHDRRAISPAPSGVNVDPQQDPIGAALIRKVSIRNTEFYQDGPVLASSASTESSSMNSRRMTADRWFDHNRGGPAMGTNQTVPDWCLLSQSGLTVDPPLDEASDPLSDNHVIGRFAFVVYDVGSQLDVNVAGFPSLPALGTRLSRKGSPVFADLGAVPGTTATDIEELTTWRHGTTGVQPDSFMQWAENKGPRAGFLKAEASMNQFFSRSDLIASAKSEERGINTTNLPFFRHFSLQVNQPSYAPTYNASERGGLDNLLDTNNRPSPLRGLVPPNGNVPAEPNGYAYRDKANFLRFDNANIYLAAPRFQSDAVLAHYRFDPANPLVPISQERHVRAGDSIIVERFPLERLRWFEGRSSYATRFAVASPPSEELRAAILKHFGLIWLPIVFATDQGAWSYVSPDGDVSTGMVNPFPKWRILSLQEVAERNREPDFFELLKAGMLRGSLGSSINNTLPRSAGGRPDETVLQIGLNMIGQVESSSHPVSARFGVDGTTQGATSFLFSRENIPFPYKWHMGLFRPSAGSTGQNSENNDWVHLLMEVEMWNHNQRALPGDSSERPAVANSQYRQPGTGMRFDRGWGQSNMVNYWRFISPDSLPGDPPTTINPSDTSYLGRLANPTEGPATLASQTQRHQIYAIYSGENFREPTLLTSSQTITHRGQDGMNPNVAAGGLAPAGFAGMWLGRARIPALSPVTGGMVEQIEVEIGDKRLSSRGFPAAPSPPSSSSANDDGTSNDGGFQLQPMSTFETNTTTRINNRNLSVPFSNSLTMTKRYLGGDSPDSFSTFQRIASYGVVDPTNSRFGVSELRAPNTGESMRPNVAALSSPNYGFRFLIPAGITWEPSQYSDLNMEFGEGEDNYFPIVSPVASRTAGSQTADQNVHLSLWTDNRDADIGGQRVYYRDNDRVIRRGDGDLAHGVDPLANTVEARAARPIIMNTPLVSTGELSYTSRPQPWRTINFAFPDSADAGLLDLFTPSEMPSLTAGPVNLNSRLPESLSAYIRGTGLQFPTSDVPNPGVITDTMSDALAAAILTQTGTAPFENKASYVTDFNNGVDLIADGLGTNGYIKHRQEVVMRALADTTQTRTWNLMIDVVVQVGRYTSRSTSLDQFLVEGEHRYWVHLALDRHTNKVVNVQWESVTP